MKFQSHVPGWADVEPAIPLQEFDTLESLLSHSWIQGWKDKERKDLKFYWTPNNGKWSKACLMAMWTQDGDHHWWVLGYMDEIPKELPEWKCPE